jgi:hypothetical protein
MKKRETKDGKTEQQAPPAPPPRRERRKKPPRRKFKETFVGFLLQHETPMEYELITDVTAMMRKAAPPVELIEAICYISGHPLFRTIKFWRALTAYRKYGLYHQKIKRTDVRKEIYYARLKKNRCLEMIF